MNSKLIYSYIIFLILFTAFSYSFVDPNLSYLKFLYTGFSLNHRFWTMFLYFLFISVYFIYYAIFINKAKKNGINLKLIIFLTSSILFLSYPAMLSFDIFNYIATSKVLFGYHENPYIFKPIEFIGDPLLQFTRASNKVALYGPIWILVSAIPYFLGFGNFILTLFGFKLIAIFSYVVATFLMMKITRSVLATAIFSLNPLVIVETLVSGHNDLFMMFLALFSFYLLFKKQKLGSTVSFIFSVFIKYSTFFLIPVYAFAFWQTLKNKNINWGKVYFISSISMFIIFLLSPLREELYPWYAIWFLIFSSITHNRKILAYLSFGISIGLLWSYIPYMFLGTYFGITPYLKATIILIPTLASILFVLRRRLWLRIFFWQ